MNNADERFHLDRVSSDDDLIEGVKKTFTINICAPNNSFVSPLEVLWQKIDRPMVNQSNEGGQEQLTLIAFDGVVYSNKDHYRLESDYVGSYNLIIDRVNEDDQGEYQCQINTEPRKTKRIFLTVQGRSLSPSSSPSDT